MMMTDNEIIKALECCIKSNCNECPFYKDWITHRCGELKELALDLINRQKAENERLQIRNKTLSAITKNYDWKFAKAKSEAIKEFWKKAKEKGTTAYYDYQQRPCVWVEDGDNLVKEMVGE